MATPSEHLSGREKRVHSDSDASSADISLRDTKRLKRTQVNLVQTTPAVLPSLDNENAFPPRRRVNPDSLAIRLPVDLVRELNALILPGHTEMPTFAIRKELQERYMIDRRHIYDYFHSKGLRVVKEDRISNLIRGRRIQPSTPSQPPQSPHISKKIPLTEPERSLSAPLVIAKLPTAQRQKKTGETWIPRSGNSNPSEPAGITVSYPKPYKFVNPLDHSVSLQYQEGGPVCDSSRPAGMASVNCLEDGSPLPWAAVDTDSCRTQYVSEQVSEFVGFQTATRESIASPHASSFQQSRNAFLPLDKVPSQNERILFYNMLNDNLGPPRGLQECVGTYKAHMAERSRLYFERLLSSSRPARRNDAQSARSNQDQTSAPDSRVDFDVNFRKWLSSNKPPGIQTVSNPCSEAPRVLVSKPLVLPQGNLTPVRETLLFPLETDLGGDTLDDLFPRPLSPLKPYCMQDVVGSESPVLRSEPARPLSPLFGGQNFVLGSASTRARPQGLISRRNTHTSTWPTSSSVFHLSLPTNSDQAAMSSTVTARISTKSTHRQHPYNDSAHSLLNLRSRPFKRVAYLESGRMASRSDRMRTTSAGGGI